jgi:hypothetical protein
VTAGFFFRRESNSKSLVTRAVALAAFRLSALTFVAVALAAVALTVTRLALRANWVLGCNGCAVSNS